MRVVNTDAKSYLSKTEKRCLQDAVKAKKKIFLEAYIQQRQHFSPFFASIDGLLSVEVEENLNRIAIHLAKKWQQPYLRTC